MGLSEDLTNVYQKLHQPIYNKPLKSLSRCSGTERHPLVFYGPKKRKHAILEVFVGVSLLNLGLPGDLAKVSSPPRVPPSGGG